QVHEEDEEEHREDERRVAVAAPADVRPHHVVPEIEDERLGRVREPARRSLPAAPRQAPRHGHEERDAERRGQEDEHELARGRQVEREPADVDRLHRPATQVEVQPRELQLARVLEVVGDEVRDLADAAQTVRLGRGAVRVLRGVGALRESVDHRAYSGSPRSRARKAASRRRKTKRKPAVDSTSVSGAGAPSTRTPMPTTATSAIRPSIPPPHQRRNPRSSCRARRRASNRTTWSDTESIAAPARAVRSGPSRKGMATAAVRATTPTRAAK